MGGLVFYQPVDSYFLIVSLISLGGMPFNKKHRSLWEKVILTTADWHSVISSKHI